LARTSFIDPERRLVAHEGLTPAPTAERPMGATMKTAELKTGLMRLLAVAGASAVLVCTSLNSLAAADPPGGTAAKSADKPKEPAKDKLIFRSGKEVTARSSRRPTPR
jgi:hypothetical protein